MTEQHSTQQENSSQSPEASFSQKPSFGARVAEFLSHPKAPYWVGAVVLAAAGTFGLYLKGPSAQLSPFGGPAIVMFDPVRFTNAQRAAASILAVRPDADTSLTLTQVAKQAELVIREEAHGAVVLVKQAVVAPEGITDITDAVLARFGLPTNVPTVTTDLTSDEFENAAPTDSTFSSGKLREDYRLELEGKRAKLAEDHARAADQSNILP